MNSPGMRSSAAAVNSAEKSRSRNESVELLRIVADNLKAIERAESLISKGAPDEGS